MDKVDDDLEIKLVSTIDSRLNRDLKIDWKIKPELKVGLRT